MDGNKPVRKLHAVLTQELLSHIAKSATAKGMKINEEKNRPYVYVRGNRLRAPSLSDAGWQSCLRDQEHEDPRGHNQ